MKRSRIFGLFHPATVGLAMFLLPLAARAAETAELLGPAALWERSDLVARATLVVLVAMSIANWYVVIVRAIERTVLARRFRRATAILLDAPSVEATLAGVPVATRALITLGIEADRSWERMPDGSIDRHTWIAHRLKNGVGEALGSGAAIIPAIVGSTSPFVGLFGTVWGIHHALTEIGLSGQASIDRVAGPVGEALIMTAIGLVVAVPAVIGHNWLIKLERNATATVRGLANATHDALLAGRVVEERRRPRLSVGRD